MTLQEIKERYSTLDVYEQRNSTAEYDELVFYSKDREKWEKTLSDVLGVPIKPAGAEPTQEHVRLTENYGGIYSNQTLFKKDFEDFSVIAMLWPWQDEAHTTLKVVLLKDGGQGKKTEVVKNSIFSKFKKVFK